MVYVFNVGFEVGDVLVLHALTDKQRIGAFPKFIHQDILPLHGVDVLGQVVQDVVVDTGVEVSDRCRNEQQDTDDENGYTQFDDLFTEFQHRDPFLPF